MALLFLFVALVIIGWVIYAAIDFGEPARTRWLGAKHRFTI
jgi:hypothetical protein